MKVLVFFLVVLSVACAQRRFFPGFRFPYFVQPVDEVYAASLGGAPVGLYDRRTDGGFGGFGGMGRFRYPYGYGGRGDDVSSASLGGAKVGVYGKDQGRRI